MHGPPGREPALEFRKAWNEYFSRDIPNLMLRCALMLIGVACVGVGIALSKYSTTGTSPISCIPAVLADYAQWHGNTFITLGMLTFLINVAFLVGEVILLRGDFAPVQLLQLGALFAMSWFIDSSMGLIRHIPLPGYVSQFVCLVASLFVLGFGIACELKANILMVPGDAIVHVIAYVSRKPFHRCKVIFDMSLMLGGAVLSLVLLSGLYGVREGSVMSALLVGGLVRMWGRVLVIADPWIPPAPRVWVPPIVPGVRGE